MLLWASENTAGSHDPRHLRSCTMYCRLAHRLCCVSADCTQPNRESLAWEEQTRTRCCAGNPLQEMKTAGGTVLTYYKEAPILP